MFLEQCKCYISGQAGGAALHDRRLAGVCCPGLSVSGRALCVDSDGGGLRCKYSLLVVSYLAASVSYLAASVSYLAASVSYLAA